MVRTVIASGTKTIAVADGEQTLLDDISNQGSILDALLDLNNMTATEVLEIRVYVKVLTGGTLHRLYYGKFSGAQSNEGTIPPMSPVIYVPGITEPFEWKLTIKLTVGSSRTFDWGVYGGP